MLRSRTCATSSVGSWAVRRAAAQAILDGRPHLVKLVPEVLLALLLHAEVLSQAAESLPVLFCVHALVAFKPNPLVLLRQPNPSHLVVERLDALQVNLGSR